LLSPRGPVGFICPSEPQFRLQVFDQTLPIDLHRKVAFLMSQGWSPVEIVAESEGRAIGDLVQI
jgi:hypothetical protein